MNDLDEKLKQAREMSWKTFGRRITFFLPGIFCYNGLYGRYPAISITGSQCALQCDHCRGKILEPMTSAMTPDLLTEQCIRLAQKGNHGVLLSGGCDEEGRLPWDRFMPAIKEIKGHTDLYISVHCGLIDYATALQLKEVGVNQALIDVIGDDDTYRDIYHVDFGVSKILSSMESLQKSNMPIIPHIVCGLHYGKIKGENKAVEMIAQFDVDQVVIVSLMPIPGTPLWNGALPGAGEVAEIIAETRFKLPRARINLGCARERGNIPMELLAIDAGVNRMAIPSEEAIRRTEDYGLEIRYQRTCCSVSKDYSKKEW
ncbi:MAG: radical SAM protein [Desulfobacteraceae bacterium]|nr:MAG: radical SAM protein [Desulfobacteraceae bacterium]